MWFWNFSFNVNVEFSIEGGKHWRELVNYKYPAVKWGEAGQSNHLALLNFTLVSCVQFIIFLKHFVFHTIVYLCYFLLWFPLLSFIYVTFLLWFPLVSDICPEHIYPDILYSRDNWLLSSLVSIPNRFNILQYNGIVTKCIYIFWLIAYLHCFTLFSTKLGIFLLKKVFQSFKLLMCKIYLCGIWT